jgi:hypothetical protein
LVEALCHKPEVAVSIPDEVMGFSLIYINVPAQPLTGIFLKK